jgi:hypothetical protein
LADYLFAVLVSRVSGSAQVSAQKVDLRHYNLLSHSVNKFNRKNGSKHQKIFFNSIQRSRVQYYGKLCREIDAGHVA